MKDKSRLKRLADFAPIFPDPNFAFGKMHPIRGKGTSTEPFEFPSNELSDAANQFVEMTYTADWVLKDFDWSEWGQSDEGQTLLTNRAALASANIGELAKLLTVIIRRDRFVEGSLSEDFENGLILAVAERAENLLKSFGEGAPLANATRSES